MSNWKTVGRHLAYWALMPILGAILASSLGWWAVPVGVLIGAIAGAWAKAQGAE